MLRDHPKLSLSRFAGEVERPYHVLRDARQNAERSAQRTERRQHVLEEVRLKALEEPLSGYRLIYQATYNKMFCGLLRASILFVAAWWS
ncbi:hypothetical protein [Deinococcus radiophilus]|uniref:hypothetical protein n=1 Tax=Deinococcus radiophilus TaxID=32062 RepID=UPI001E57681D|nr:hypothetical protein [Deinococcus radiophilus]UFA51675.1 hypothetical protein LMT64_11410 [Deinococcus radiophilus]